MARRRCRGDASVSHGTKPMGLGRSKPKARAGAGPGPKQAAVGAGAAAPAGAAEQHPVQLDTPRIAITRASRQSLISLSAVPEEEQRPIHECSDWGPYFRHRSPSTVAALGSPPSK